MDGVIGAEDDLADGGAGRCGQADGDDVALDGLVEGRVEQLVQFLRLDAHDGLFFADEAFADEVGGDLHHRAAGALAAARLQEPEAALLNRELDVLHVAVVLLERLR